MLAQYLEIKAQHPGALLLFRMGDFFETFFEDAQTLARVAGVTLTSRDSKSDTPGPAGRRAAPRAGHLPDRAC